MNVRQENEAVLRDLGYVPGVELAPRRVDFNLVFSTETGRSEAQGSITSLGFEWIDRDEAVEDGTFEAIAFRMISPAADSISENEITLIDRLSTFGGMVDGWGFFRDTVQ